MKNLKVLFAALVLVVSFAACSPDHDEVTPDNSRNQEKFEVKSDETPPAMPGKD